MVKNEDSSWPEAAVWIALFAAFVVICAVLLQGGDNRVCPLAFEGRLTGINMQVAPSSVANVSLNDASFTGRVETQVYCKNISSFLK